VTTIVWGLAAAPAIGLAATLVALDPASPVDAAARGAGGARGEPMPRLLWAAIAAAALIQASHAALYGFGSIHWRSLGFSDAAIGTLWGAGIVVEMGVFALFGGRVGHGSPGFGLIALGGATAAVRFTLMSFDPGLPATFALQALHGLSFGATHLGGMAALAALTPASTRGRSQGYYASLNSLAMAVATIASGPLYRMLGSLAFAALAPLALVGCGLALWGLSQPQSEGEGGCTRLPS